MFQSARVRLTAFYLLIIMIISFLFSFAAYNRFHRELGRLEGMPSPPFERRVFLRNDQVIFEEIRQRLLRSLIFINAAILVVAGGLGYWLSGKTLKPIESMMKEQNRFISDASHELKTPLTSLKTAFEVYLRRKKSRIVSESLAEVNQLQNLTEGLLRLTHNQSADLVPVSLNTVINQAVKQVKVLVQAKQIKIFAPKTGLKIKGNQEQLTELLVILLDNAIKYSPSKSVVKIQVEKFDGKAVIKVIDQGMGIAEKDLPHIFDRFYRADSARTKNNSGGYGLGLAIAKKLTQANNGSIQAVSELGQGSTFQLSFSLIK